MLSGLRAAASTRLPLAATSRVLLLPAGCRWCWPAPPASSLKLPTLLHSLVLLLQVVLASASQFFEALFAGAGSRMAEAGATTVHLPGVDGPTLHQVGRGGEVVGGRGSERGGGGEVGA